MGWGGSGFQTLVINIVFVYFFILVALRKFKVNDEVSTSFKIEKIELPLTVPHPRADLLLQMPHPGVDKVVKCLGGDARGWN